MDFHGLHSSGLDKTLKCFACKNYLSYFPISLCSNNQSLCGRCVVPSGRISYRDEAFETICQFLKFPCRYQSEGCPEELAPRDMPVHEKNCLFSTVQCIINKPLHCNWEGSLLSLLTHCRTEHSDLILKNGEFQMDFSVSHEYDSLLEHNDDLFIFTRRFDSTTDILSCALYNHEYSVNTTSCSAQLSVKNGNRTLLLDLKATGFTEIIFTELSVHSVRSGDKQDSFLCQINMLNTKSEEYQRVGINAAIFADLQCTICFEFALPPIYRCLKNRATVCSDCKERHRPSCNICSRITLFQKSDTALDAIGVLAKYPCKYRKNGCTSTLEFHQMKGHYNVCDYVIVKCPFSELNTCEWNGSKRDVNDHVLKNHQDLLLYSSDKLEISTDDKNIYYRLIQFSNRLFRLTYCMHDEDASFMWKVETIGSGQIKFKYEIDIVDGSNSGKRMLIREYCNDLTDKNDDYLYFDEDQYSNFLIKQNGVEVLKFHVNIFR